MASSNIFGPATPRELTPEEAEHKRAIYERMSSRGRRFVDRQGYDAWDPFQEPKEPMDIRKDVGKRTTRELLRLFLREKGEAAGGASPGNLYSQGALECALGLINKEEKYRGVFDFCLWYADLLRKEGLNI